jgi:hypothetical protein
MRHCIEQSNGLVPSLLYPSWVDCIIATRGYDFRKGQPSRIPKMLIREPKARSPSHDLNLPLAHRRNRLLQLICLQTAAEILASPKSMAWKPRFENGAAAHSQNTKGDLVPDFSRKSRVKMSEQRLDFLI